MTAHVMEIRRLVRWRLARWHTHPDWEDLEQEAVVAAWQALQTAEKGLAVSTVVAHAADWAALDFLRSQRASARVPRAGQAPHPVLLSLEEVRHVACPDFAPRLLELLSAQELAALAGRLNPGRAGHLLWRAAALGENQAALAREHGISRSRLEGLLALAKNRVRLSLGLPERGWSDARQREKDRRRNARRAAAHPARPRPLTCAHGHALTPENSYLRKDGGRQCRLCGRRRTQECRERQKEKTRGLVVQPEPG